jgi:hypothetical protein
MQRTRTDAAAIQLVDLILHQRDQRRHDQRDAGQHHRRQLIAERLARSRRHHRQHVAAAEHRRDDLFLSLAKSGCRNARATRRARRQPLVHIDDDDHIVCVGKQY